MLTEQDRRNLAATGSGHDEKHAHRPSPSPRPPTAVQSEHTRVATASPNNDQYDHGRSTTPFSFSGRTPTLFNIKRASRAPTVIRRSSPITRLNLIASAERIFYRYLSPAANTVNSTENHEIYLPPSLRIHSFPLSSSHEPRTETELNLLAQIPDIFHAQKEYCFNAMEQDAFPRFLRSKAFGNLTPVSALVRLIAGLILLWIGLAVAFSLIFLDVLPKAKRFFVSAPFLDLLPHKLPSSLVPSSLVPSSLSGFIIVSSLRFDMDANHSHPLTIENHPQLFIPFTIAILFLVSHQYELDPILVFFGQSETTPFRTLTIREPYVKKLLFGRAIWVTVLVAVFVTGLTLMFWAVPGYRL